MASFPLADAPDLEVLDAGAGAGALITALVRRLCTGRSKPRRVSVTAYEVDSAVMGALHESLAWCGEQCESNQISFQARVHNEDFISAGAAFLRGELFAAHLPAFNLAIINPPYRKIRADSSARLLLAAEGIETTNLYTGFVALVTRLLATRGELVAITPRSFCNGRYFRPFRKELLATMSLRRLHLFESRSAAFGSDAVLQENVILHAVKHEAAPARLVVSSSQGELGGPVHERLVAFEDVVASGDTESFIHLATTAVQGTAKRAMEGLSASLSETGLSVSTGRVVDFRVRSSLRQRMEPGAVPLIYPCHFNGGFVHWPKPSGRKPNAIVVNPETRGQLVPSGIYVLVKRFTSKEERRRVVACIYDPRRVRLTEVGFENHLNYFHMDGGGLPLGLAKGLAAFLNSTIVDDFFRRFSGHTQVNVTDLRALRYPTRAALERLGRKLEDMAASQSELDGLVEKEVF
jgi:adenine-specific DNA-methyltransferase